MRASDLRRAIAHNGGAKCALDIALHDLVGKVAGVPVHRLLGLSDEIPPTDFTIGIDEPAVVAERAARAARFPALKIKVRRRRPTSRRSRRSAASTTARSGSTRTPAGRPTTRSRCCPTLVRPRRRARSSSRSRRAASTSCAGSRSVSALPIVADESAVTIDDLDGLVGVVAGVNVKLAKCGGVGPAARMLARARELGFRTFLGCMEETSVGIAASAAVASLADWVDLDGNLLLADDPFEGLELGADCRWRLSDSPGLGLTRRPA